jgi:hypothetical protein
MPMLRVVLSTNDFALETTEVTLPDGSTLRNDFYNAQSNGVIPEDLLHPVIGPEVKVVRP